MNFQHWFDMAKVGYMSWELTSISEWHAIILLGNKTIHNGNETILLEHTSFAISLSTCVSIASQSSSSLSTVSHVSFSRLQSAVILSDIVFSLVSNSDCMVVRLSFRVRYWWEPPVKCYSNDIMQILKSYCGLFSTWPLHTPIIVRYHQSWFYAYFKELEKMAIFRAFMQISSM